MQTRKILLNDVINNYNIVLQTRKFLLKSIGVGNLEHVYSQFQQTSITKTPQATPPSIQKYL